MKFLDSAKRLYNSLMSINGDLASINNNSYQAEALLVESIYLQRLSAHKNEFAKKYARKHFSQSDEDGITLEIVRRIKSLKKDYGKYFAEFGVGDGCENNTLVLLSLGWNGSWFGGEQLAFDPHQSKRLCFHEGWITRANILSLYKQVLEEWKINDLDVVSLDLDGNDIYFIESILSAGHKPALFICEYNAIFPPGSSWQIDYDGNHHWQGDHYFGASLDSFARLFKKHDYFLCACNPHTGANAFFVRNEFRELFSDVSNNIEDVYVPPFYRLENRFTHRISPMFIKSIIA